MASQDEETTAKAGKNPNNNDVDPASPASPGAASVELHPHYNWNPTSPPLRSIFRGDDHRSTPGTNKSSPLPSLALENEDLGEAPVEREAGLQILKAWQDIERKARRAAMQTPEERELEEENIYNTLEDDDDAVVFSKLTQKNSKETENEQLEVEEEKKDLEDEGEEVVLLNGTPPSPLNGAAAAAAAKDPSRKVPTPLKPPAKTDDVESKISQRSGKSLARRRINKTHKRAESVEMAMFGLLADDDSTQTKNQGKLIQVMSSDKEHPLKGAPLQATERLIQTAQNRVMDVQAQAKKKKQQQQQKQSVRGHTLLETLDEEDRESEFKDIINADGDKVDIREEDGALDRSVLNRIDEDSDDGEPTEDEETGKRSSRRKWKRNHHVVREVTAGVQQDWELFQQFLTPRKASIFFYLKIGIFLVILPCMIIAALLFYLKEYPEQQEAGIPKEEYKHPNLSWWFLFIGVRQIITLSMALITQALFVDYLALGSRFSLKFLGPAVTLLAVQARGWPCVLTLWAIYDLILLAGDRPLAHHWGYWQDVIKLFNESNHSGYIVQNEWNFRILITAAVVGVVVAIKRVLVGLFLARKTLKNFGDEFENVKKNMILIGELATLGMEIEIDYRGGGLPFSVRADHTAYSVSSLNLKTIKKTLTTFSERSATSAEDSAITNPAHAANKFVSQWKKNSAASTAENNTAPRSVIAVDEGETDLDSLTFVAEDAAGDDELKPAEHAEIAELLDEWEGQEDRLERKQTKSITIGAILKFYKEITVMNRKYPFLPVFGRADSRDKCINSAQRLFDRLMLRTPTAQKLTFSTIAILARDDYDGPMSKEKLRELIRLFRPDRDGKLSKLDFVKSIDSVYRDLRLLSLNIEDNVQIDKAVELLFNIIFYIVVGSIVLHVMGVNPLQLFVSLSGVILGSVFIFGASSAKWFEGILFILVQRPYGVGDRIHLSDPASETSPNGSSGWIVEKVTLNTTTVYWGATNERATLSNGAIANLRVINAARSPKATIYVHMKFGIDTHYKKIQVFRSAAEQYLKGRPREWAAFIGFRPNDVVIDRGYIGYTLIAQHREGWQKIGAILTSKANLTTFMLEVSKQLNMRYVSPPLPVDLRVEDASAALRTAGVRGQDIQQGKTKDSVESSFF